MLRPIAIAASTLLLLWLAASCGGGCSTSADCPADSYCPDVKGAQCTPRLQAGDHCEQSDACAAGLVCNTTLATCEPTEGSGSPCIGSADCTGDESCDLATGTCRTLGPAGSGDPCSVENDCGRDLTCSDFRCIPATTEGGACGSAPDSCAEDLVCLTGLGSPSCEKQRSAGPCRRDVECTSRHCVAGSC